jgi:hypothetical protein
MREKKPVLLPRGPSAETILLYFSTGKVWAWFYFGGAKGWKDNQQIFKGGTGT